MASAAHRDIDSLKEDVRRIREDFQRLVGSTSRGPGGHIGEAVSREGRDAALQARECSEHALDQTREMGDRAVGRTRRAVARRPVSSVVAVLFGGIVIGALLDSLR